MDAASTIINLGLFAVTTIAAIIAWRSVRDAQRARDDASASEKSAAAAASESAAAATRSAKAAEAAAEQQRRTADAIERQTALLEAGALTHEAWRFEAMSPPTIDQQWAVTNHTGHTARAVSIGTPDGEAEKWIQQPNDQSIDVEPGAAIRFTFIRRLSSPHSRTIWVFWTPADGGSQQKYVHEIS